MTIHTSVYTHPFNGPLSGTTRVSQYQKGKTNLDFSEARDSEWQWHRLDHMQVCTSLQTDNHANTSLLSFFSGTRIYKNKVTEDVYGPVLLNGLLTSVSNTEPSLNSFHQELKTLYFRRAYLRDQARS